MRRRWRPALALGGLLFLAAGALYAATGGAGDPLSGMDPPAMAFRLLKSAAGWSWVVAILGLADSRTAAAPTTPAAPGRRPRPGAAASDVVLAFYLLHEPVVVAVAYVVLSWRLAAGVQYLLISGVSLAVTVLLCGLVRRGRVTIQPLVDAAVARLAAAWGCQVRRHRGPRVVPVEENYDRLRIPPTPSPAACATPATLTGAACCAAMPRR
jgi:hypothetical protein